MKIEEMEYTYQMCSHGVISPDTVMLVSAKWYRYIKRKTKGGIPHRLEPRKSHRDESRYRFKTKVKG